MNGATVHFPTHGGGNVVLVVEEAAQAEPFFCNAEHLAEKNLQFVGQHIIDTITVPVAVNAENIDQVIASQRIIAGANKCIGNRSPLNCACQLEHYAPMSSLTCC